MDLTDIIYSNDYINILIQNYVAQSERYQMLFPESSALLTLNSQYSVLFLERSLLPENLFGEILFTGLPKLFTPLSTLSLEVSGIVQTQNLYGGGYTGKNVILGFLDTGIDYRHPAFLRSNGQSRILSIWDQTDRTGTPPPQFPYGSLYEKSDLDDALRSRDPLSVVPVTDPDGHGTYVAGVAGGTPNASAGFLGAAPEADFAVVKLKPAKQNLKDFSLCDAFSKRSRSQGGKTTGHLSGTWNKSGKSFRNPSHRSDAGALRKYAGHYSGLRHRRRGKRRSPLLWLRIRK